MVDHHDEVDAFFSAEDEHQKMIQIFARTWVDKDFAARFKNEPKAVMREFGIFPPDDLDFEVVQNTMDKVYITIPANYEDAKTIEEAIACLEQDFDDEDEF